MIWLLILTHLITIPAAVFVGACIERQRTAAWERHVTQAIRLAGEPARPVPCRAGCGRTASIADWCVGCAPAGLLADQPIWRQTP